MPTEQVEVECKYDVGPGAGDVPDLSALPGVARVAPAEQLDQTATYLDTEGLALFAGHVTLRRRIGGVDDGWHLKLPAGDRRREEVHSPIADPSDPDEAVPGELVDRVRAMVRDHPLVPVAVLRTRRRLHRLLGSEGEVLAELCDDRVEARTKALQQVLGEHQDSVVARQMLRDLGIRAHLGGENGFTFGRLHALEEAHAAALARQYLEVWADLPGTSGLRSRLRG